MPYGGNLWTTPLYMDAGVHGYSNATVYSGGTSFVRSTTGDGAEHIGSCIIKIFQSET